MSSGSAQLKNIDGNDWLIVVSIEEAAKFLFVSQLHIRRLLERRVLDEVLPRNPSGDVDIDGTSVQAYRAKQDAAVRAYLDSQTEESGPSGP
ncbi:hypothetical protein [Burkholderia aenigmatica]|uniref:Uncharacterized protein n=1 Tax=Burkholderia aenigmatica TaxID=2015348 RepID=A0A228INR8_9BURK|nr:hypothetical protein [Burkholderia aenigmatica]OXI43819.1 hypothetical protein CFB84_19975 [Burkholderia aenigmatica]